MATYSFDKTNKIITAVSPATEVTIQDLLNNIREYEEDPENMEIAKIANASGKEELGGGVLVGITLTLLDWKLKFEDRTGPSYTLCNVSGGNVVYLNTTTEVYGNPIEPSAFVTVTITASSSATLADLDAIQYASYGNVISLDVTSSNSGTDYPTGNKEYPVNNITDAVTIANVKGFTTIEIRTDMTGADKIDGGTDISNFTLKGQSSAATTIEIDSLAVCVNVNIRDCNIFGTLDGGACLTDCLVGDIVYFNGHIMNCGLYGTIYLDGNEEATINNCYTFDQDSSPIIDMGGSGQDLAMPNYSGLVAIKNLTSSTEEIGIGLNAGMVTLDSTISAGTIIIGGTGLLVDNSTGTASVNIDGLLNRELITKTTWDTVWINVTDGTSGTDFPIGTEKNPVNNLADALLISATENIERLHINGALTITTGQDISGYTLISDRSLGNVVTINSGAITDETYFENLTVSGTMNGSVRCTTSVLGAINNFDGGAKNCLLTNTINITGTGSNYLTDCDSYITNPANKVEISIGSTNLNIIKCRGGFLLTDKTSTTTTAVDLVAGLIEVDSTCTAGAIQIGGICEVTDNSGAGCTVSVLSMSHTAISENVWDEPLTAALHNEPTSAGKRLRGLTSMVIRNELSQGPGTGNNQIQLDVDASTLDGAYDPSMVTIIAGTGLGQTRQILDYVGSTRMATVDRNWKVNPDSTSEYAIISHAGREHVNEGLATAGTSTTITLNAFASSQNNAYKGQVVFIRSGTGEDTARRITSYDGLSKIATVGSNFPITPDSTSGYVILPTGTITHQMIGDAVWDSVIANYTDTGSSGELINILRKIETNRWKIESNQFKIYDDNGTSVLYTFDLKDSVGSPTEDSPKERDPV